MAGTLGTTTTTEDARSQLFAAEMPRTIPGTVVTGEGVVARGTPMELNGTTFKWEVMAAAAGANLAGVALEDIDATSADVSTRIGVAGVYRDADIVWPDAISDAQKNAALSAGLGVGIYFDVDFVHA